VALEGTGSLARIGGVILEENISNESAPEKAIGATQCSGLVILYVQLQNVDSLVVQLAIKHYGLDFNGGVWA
jgi:hypothetical protein